MCYNFYDAVRHNKVGYYSLAEVGMKYIYHLFLFSVGIITIAYDELAGSIQKALDTIQEEREKLAENLTKQEL